MKFISINILLALSALNLAAQTRQLELAYLQEEAESELRECAFYGEAPPPLLRVTIYNTDSVPYSVLAYGYTLRHTDNYTVKNHPLFNQADLDSLEIWNTYGEGLEIIHASPTDSLKNSKDSQIPKRLWVWPIIVLSGLLLRKRIV